MLWYSKFLLATPKPTHVDHWPCMQSSYALPWCLQNSSQDWPSTLAVRAQSRRWRLKSEFGMGSSRTTYQKNLSWTGWDLHRKTDLPTIRGCCFPIGAVCWCQVGHGHKSKDRSKTIMLSSIRSHFVNPPNKCRKAFPQWYLDDVFPCLPHNVRVANVPTSAGIFFVASIHIYIYRYN